MRNVRTDYLTKNTNYSAFNSIQLLELGMGISNED